jgi:CRP/FNR family transcriptional regulator
MKIRWDHDVVDAIACSALRILPSELLDELTHDAFLRDVPAGTTTHRDGEPPFAELVVSGLIRAYLASPAGRTMTARYCRKGALMGIATLFSESRPRAHGTTAAVVHSRVLGLQPITVRRLAGDARVARALLNETSERVMEFIEELEITSFGSLRQRLVRNLLDIAADQQQGARLVARVSQEELAGTIGTVREIVVRILRDLREEGLVQTGREGVVLLDPARMYDETYPRGSHPEI